MDNPEDNYEFEFHAKTPENDKNIGGLRWGIFWNWKVFGIMRKNMV